MRTFTNYQKFLKEIEKVKELNYKPSLLLHACCTPCSCYPLILLKDGALLGHRGLREFVLEVCEKHNIPYQIDYLASGGTDAGAMHLAHSGAPAMSLCIPSRYIHSHTSMISKSDYENAIKLLTEVIKALDKEAYEKIKEA